MEGVEKGERLHEGIEGGMVVNWARRCTAGRRGREEGGRGGMQETHAPWTCLRDPPGIHFQIKHLQVFSVSAVLDLGNVRAHFELQTMPWH